jgi:ubiquinol-cytochrome c reductase iron-sulfur subunit
VPILSVDFATPSAYTDLRIIKVIIKWRGKPVFIRHRTQDEIQEAQQYDWKTLRDPQPDEDRVQKPEWLVMLGML